MLGYLRLHVRVTLCTTQAVEEQLTYTINKWTEVISHCAYHENGLTSFERISYNSLSVKSPSGYASVFKGIPNYATRIRSDKAEPRVLTKYSATHSTADALMTSCTISTVVPLIPPYFHDRSLIFRVTLSRNHSLWFCITSLFGKSASSTCRHC